jgi:cyanate lyase
VLEQAALEGGGSSFQDIDATTTISPPIKSQVLNRQQLLNQDEQDLLAEVLKDSEILQLRHDLIEACLPSPERLVFLQRWAPHPQRTQQGSPPPNTSM